MSTVMKNQVEFVELLLNHLKNKNIALNLFRYYEKALKYENQTSVE
jgi:hypothetical protein